MASTADLAALGARLRRPLRTGADAAPHEQPWRGEPGPCLAVALPVDVAEVREVVLWARHHRVGVLPQGAVTGLVGASTPPPPGSPGGTSAPLVLSTDALRGRLEIDPDAATAVASAGIRLSELNAAAAAHGLELPVDLAADPSLGGMVATNTGGSRVLRHGDMSAHVLSVEAVAADAAAGVIGSARPLRKDNTGPGIDRLLIGSAGALAVVTTVAVALSPVPEERATALVPRVSDHEAVALLGPLRRALGDALSAYEVMSATAARAGMARMASPPALDPGGEPTVTVLVEASGPVGIGDRLVDAVHRASPRLAEDAVLVPPEAAWGLRHAITDGLRAGGRVIGLDLGLPCSAMPVLRRAVRDMAAAADPSWQVADFGHWGDGGVHCNVVVPHGAGTDAGHVENDRTDHDAQAERITRLRDAVYALVVDRLGGSFSAEHGIGPVNATWWRRATPPLEQAALAAVRRELDPLGILGHPGLPFGGPA